MALALLCLVGAGPLVGQVLSAGISAAPVLQVGTFGDGRSLGTGWHVGVNARLDMRTRPFGVQFDAGVASSPYADAAREGRVQSWDAGLSGFWRPVASSRPVRPYLMGGLGVYYVEEPERNTITPALSVGAGVEAGTRSVRAFVEARYHYVFTWDNDLQYVPVSLGVRYAFNP